MNRSHVNVVSNVVVLNERGLKCIGLNRPHTVTSN